MFTGGRTPSSVDGIVLMDEVCLLGPGADAHIRARTGRRRSSCSAATASCGCGRSRPIDVDGETVTEGTGLVADGSVISGQGWRFRVEGVGTSNQGHS